MADPKEIYIDAPFTKNDLEAAAAQKFFAFSTDLYNVTAWNRVFVSWGWTQPRQVFVQPALRHATGNPDSYAVTTAAMKPELITFMLWRVDGRTDPTQNLAFDILVFF